ncbi:MAG: 3'(2'),5'-bisphosphate nucleotidase CysQ [Pseudomonadales bacterium]|nr:3'(2'),5'-bisphosphate nucleotidase CysQ [Pseudomonadales bacterium]
MEKLLQGIVTICQQAGEAILDIYQREDLGIQIKDDNSPLTAADLAAHQIIVDGLTSLAPDIPILSEESDALPYATRTSWNQYFLVDPLDGTKEFIERNGEFTVNVALIQDTRVVLGVVYIPVQAIVYAGIVATGLVYREYAGNKKYLSTRSVNADEITIVASRRHGVETMQKCMQLLADEFTVVSKSVGSSLKFCMIAAAEADLYLRFAPTSEWDTAAAQAIVEAAGGSVVDTDFNALRYNTKESLLNPNFLVLADARYDWRRILGPVSSK